MISTPGPRAENHPPALGRWHDDRPDAHAPLLREPVHCRPSTGAAGRERRLALPESAHPRTQVVDEQPCGGVASVRGLECQRDVVGADLLRPERLAQIANRCGGRTEYRSRFGHPRPRSPEYPVRMLGLHDDATTIVPRARRKTRLFCRITAGRRSVRGKQSGISLLQSCEAQSIPCPALAGLDAPGRTGS